MTVSLFQLDLRRRGFTTKIQSTIGSFEPFRFGRYVQTVDLSYNDLRPEALIDFLPRLSRLEQLDLLDNNLLDIVPAALADWCPRLNTLELSWTGLLEVPGCLVRLPCLQRLYLRHTKISCFPQEIACRLHLSALDLALCVFLKPLPCELDSNVLPYVRYPFFDKAAFQQQPSPSPTLKEVAARHVVLTLCV